MRGTVWIPQFITHSLTLIQTTAGALESPASQLCLVVELSASYDRVTRLPPKNAGAPSGCSGPGRLAIIIWQVRYIQYLLTCQKLQRSMPYNIAKMALPEVGFSAVAILDCSHSPPMAHHDEKMQKNISRLKPMSLKLKSMFFQQISIACYWKSTSNI